MTVPLESLTIAAISVERSRAARNLLQKETGTEVMRRIALIWTTAFVISIPQGLSYEYEPGMSGFFKCRDVSNEDIYYINDTKKDNPFLA